MRYDLIDVVNQIISDNSRSSISNSINSDNLNEPCHFIITLKFFKFVTDEDAYKEQREVQILNKVSFIDVEDFKPSFTEALLNKKPLSSISDPKNYSLLQFKNMIEAIASQDREKYSEVKSLVCSLINDIFRINNSTFFIFGFVDQNDSSVLESTVTLEIMNYFMKTSPNTFSEMVQDFLQENTQQNENENLKEEYHIIETIFSEIIFYIERKVKGINFDKNFYYSLRDLSQNEKYEKLKNYLQSYNYDLNSSSLNTIYMAVIIYFNNRSKWKQLSQAYDEILKINFRADSVKEVTVNETDDLRVYYN
jgi:hypothetical protein